MSGFTRAFADAYRGRRASPAKAFVTAVGAGGAVAAGVYRLLRR
jgi:hypothetical protein